MSGIPTPGKTSGIPTPGRFRSASNVTIQPVLDTDDYASRTFAEAIRANDPAQHRASLTYNPPSSSSSPKSAFSALQSGRRSVTGRPSSVTSTPPTRTKTPSARPPSRQSDVAPRSVSRASRTFEVGDSVRIESLGYEGTLRYVGEIDRKPGLWAGVELSGGFSGKGKNDGSVNGKRYFACPPNCGVFVAATKLSPPTVGPNCRPLSVASSRGDRITPYVSGRVTPSAPYSISAGRMTPSASFGRVTPHDSRTIPLGVLGRITPSTTPSARKSKPVPGLGKLQSQVLPALETQITSGSRASKYVGLTAKQLDSRSGPSQTEYFLKAPSSPTRTSSSTDGGARSSDSPFTTPKAGVTKTPNPLNSPLVLPKSRASLNTPRPRIPSAVAMPPPASPARSTSFGSTCSPIGDHTQHDHVQWNRPPSSPDLIASGQALQSKINRLLGNSTVSDPIDVQPVSPSSQIQSTADVNVVETYESTISALNTRIETLQQEGTSLREIVSSLRSDLEQRQVVEKDRDFALAAVAKAEKETRAMERRLSEKDSRVESLERSNAQSAAELERAKAETETGLNDLQAKLDTNEALVRSLKEANETKEGAEHESNTLLKAKNAEISLLETRLDKVSTELEVERKELASQIDELRQAGQETIALYEERLSVADSRRYELEDRIIALEDQLRKVATPPSPGFAAQHATSALEIDNETLREQVQHLQKKLSMMEDTLEDARAAAEREEVSMRERIKRFKEKEESMRNELTEGRKAVEQVAKAEVLAKGRIEEVEEALRESTLALENARAEIEILRTDVTTADMSAEDVSLKVTEVARQAALERARLMDEILDLKDELSRSISQPTKTNTETMFEQEQAEVQALRMALDERSAELDSLRKKLNREMPMTGLLEHSKSPSKHESDEIKGLKHIVQELQKETLSITQRNKLLEAENILLISETDQLRQELEQEVERLKEKLSRSKKSCTDPADLQRRASSASTALSSDDDDVLSVSREDVCEICERPGHDIFTCDLLKEDAPPPRAKPSLSLTLYCVDCEGYGHVAADCPHSLDVF
ncbi:hypothetical protein L210DRAFT_3642781 [Boletus edulis BED1]|uniref:CAP-Gly domain-containing protein n=1 Tax=Boletus edulis BED1 TaxID=1328754 RepID=A0AAD4GH07_BOLED|nr:hypothetical protein L210DRAFT_3642781 [Boletus edulis BED1]